MVHKFETALASAPESWKYTPVLFKGGFIKEWDDYFFAVLSASSFGAGIFERLFCLFVRPNTCGLSIYFPSYN